MENADRAVLGASDTANALLNDLLDEPQSTKLHTYLEAIDTIKSDVKSLEEILSQVIENVHIGKHVKRWKAFSELNKASEATLTKWKSTHMELVIDSIDKNEYGTHINSCYGSLVTNIGKKRLWNFLLTQRLKDLNEQITRFLSLRNDLLKGRLYGDEKNCIDNIDLAILDGGYKTYACFNDFCEHPDPNKCSACMSEVDYIEGTVVSLNEKLRRVVKYVTTTSKRNVDRVAVFSEIGRTGESFSERLQTANSSIAFSFDDVSRWLEITATNLKLNQNYLRIFC